MLLFYCFYVIFQVAKIGKIFGFERIVLPHGGKCVLLRSEIERKQVGQLAFIQMFVLYAISLDKNDNRRHVHVFRKGGRHLHSVAKIWIERNGVPCVEVAESELTNKETRMIVEAIECNWDFVNGQITKTFAGEKTVIKNIK